MERLPVPLPDYRARRKHDGVWVYGIPVIDDSGDWIMSKKSFRLPTGDYDAYITSSSIDRSTLEMFSGRFTPEGEKIYGTDAVLF